MLVLRNIILISFLLNVLVGYTQQKEFNFIVTVDNTLKDVYIDSFIITNKENRSETINVNYVVGELSIDNEGYQKLISNNVIRIDLTVRYMTVCRDNTETFNYKIEGFKLPWLIKGSYFVLNLYDTNNRKYRKIYNPLPEKEFTFDYDWSEGSMRRVQKKLTREQKRCNK